MIIDVREIDEFSLEHIPGAINIPLSTFTPTAFPRFYPKEEPIILICRTNQRSNIMKEILLKLELVEEKQVLIYELGMIGWIKNGRPEKIL